MSNDINDIKIKSSIQSSINSFYLGAIIYFMPTGPDRCTYIGNQKLLAVIEAGNRRLALRHKVVVVDVL